MRDWRDWSELVAVAIVIALGIALLIKILDWLG